MISEEENKNQEDLQEEELKKENTEEKCMVFFNKLVRDNTAEHLEKSGIEIKKKILPKTRKKFALLRKLSEESFECLKTKSTEKLIEELADILMVFITICNNYRISWKSLLLNSSHRQNKNGKAETQQKRQDTEKVKSSLLTMAKEVIIQSNKGIKDDSFKNSLSNFFLTFLKLLDAAEISLSRIARKHQEKKEKRGEFKDFIFISYIKGPVEHNIIKNYYNKEKKTTRYEVKLIKE